MTNSVVESGGSLTIRTIITNASTNDIIIFATGAETDFDILLTNGNGKVYRLSPRGADGSVFRDGIHPGRQSTENIPVSIAKNVEGGEYTLRACRDFYIKDEKWELESNLLKLQVK